MAETLQVIMMNQSLMDPLPIKYNTCILHVLEAYYDLRQQINSQQDMIEELKQNHTKNVKDFEALATRWEAKEGDYKAELKKLEVLLSKTEGGMETVVMARSNSRVHGSQRASEEIGRGINTIKRRHRESTLENKTDDHSTIQTPISATVAKQRYSRNQTPSLTRSQLQDMEVHEGDQELGASFRSSTSGSNSSTYPLEGGIPGGAPLGLGIALDIHEKPLPNIPKDPPAGKAGRTRAERPEGMSFSFKPGDDEDLLAQGGAREVAKRHNLDEHIRHRRHTVHNQRTESPSINQQGETPRKAKVLSMMPDSRSRMSSTPSPSPSPTLHRLTDPLIRCDSTSSVVTAVRDNPGRGSVLGSQHGSRHGRPHLDRHTSSSEAVTAAARAIAASNKGVAGRDQKQNRPEPVREKAGSYEGLMSGKGKSTASSIDEPPTKRFDKRMATF
jgi:hypothetical protein